MKKTFYFTLLFLIFVSCSIKKNTPQKPLIEKGVLNLETWDFNKYGPLDLNGEWEFYWEELLDPVNYYYAKSKDKKAYIKIPGTWEKYINPQDPDKKKYKIDSYATYAVKIIGLDKNLAHNLAININQVYTSYKLFYVPGPHKGMELEPFMINGKVGKNKSAFIPAYSYKIKEFPEINDENYLIIQAANFTYRKSGMRDSPKIGLKKDLRNIFDFDRYVTLFSAGIIFIMALYHIALYTQRRGDRGSFFFSIFCSLIVIRRFIVDNVIEYAVITPDPMFFEIIRKVEYFTAYIPIPALYSFMIYIFPKEFNKLFEKIIWGVCFIFCTTVIIFNYRLYCQFLMYYQFFMLIVAIYGIISLARSIVNKRTGSIISMIGYAIFIFTVINDILSANGTIPTPYMIPYGVIVLIFCQSFIIARLFAKTHEKVEILNVDLKLLNENLELKVEERTSELSAAMEELKATNDALVTTRDQLWGEMEMAKKIQTVLLPAKPAIEGFEIAAYMKPADEVGGDYYDVINVSGRDWIVIGDVSGHGVPAGLVMMMAQTSIHTAIEQNPGLEPSKLLTIINRTLRKNIIKLNEDKYMTMTIFAVQQDGKFHFSGLHQDILIYRKEKKSVESIQTNGMWVGMFDDVEKYMKNSAFDMKRGDTILLYTDGITESWVKTSSGNIRELGCEMFGDEKMIELLQKHGEESPEEIINSILKLLENYEISDDITMLVLKKD